jgi:RNA polymerase sigma-70 factor, ECF subfamily
MSAMWREAAGARLKSEHALGALVGMQRDDSATALVADAYCAGRDRLYRRLLALTHDAEVAQDLLPDSYARLLAEVHAGRPPRNTQAWLFRVGHNLVLSRGRRLQVAMRTADRLTAPAPTSSAEDSYIDGLASDDLRSVLAVLTPTDRLTLLMAAEGYSRREMADAVGLRENALRTRLSRARGRVRRLLEESGGWTA